MLIAPKQTQAEGEKKTGRLINGMTLGWKAHLFVDLKIRVSLSFPTALL